MRKLKLLIRVGVMLLSGLLLLGLFASRLYAEAPSPLPLTASVDRLDGNRIVLRLEIPNPVFSQQTIDSHTFDVVAIPGWGSSSNPGWPKLPTRRLMVGVPAQGEIRLRLIADQFEEGLSGRIIPAPVIQYEVDPPDTVGVSGSVPDFDRSYVLSGEAYGMAEYLPEAVVTLEETGFVRDQRIVALELNPVQYNPATGVLIIHRYLEVELAFEGATQVEAVRMPGALTGPYEEVLKLGLVNYDQAKQWRIQSSASRPQTASIWPLLANAYKIFVKQDGIHQLTRARLAAAGVPVGELDPRTLQVYWGGQEIAIEVEGEEDGSFDPGDHVLFYGQEPSYKYYDSSVYWLTFGQATGMRVQERVGSSPDEPVSPSTFVARDTFEQDVGYWSQWPGPDGFDRYIWQFITAPGEGLVALDLNGVSSAEISATVVVSLLGFTTSAAVNPDHHVKLYIGTQHIGDHWWDGNQVAQRVTKSFPQSYLSDGLQNLRIVVPGDTGAANESVLMDQVVLEYGHTFQANMEVLTFTQSTTGTNAYEVGGFDGAPVIAYDVTVPESVVRMAHVQTGAQAASASIRFTDTISQPTSYLALSPAAWLTPTRIVLDSVSNLHSPSIGADYIVLAYADFLPAAHALATYREGQGLRTKVVDVQDAYDEFGFGVRDPEAIRVFLRYAYDNWQAPAPTYVVLMGDGHFDPKDNIGLGAGTFIPPYLAYIDYWMGETAADNRYVSIVGDDYWPDIILGRMPVNSLAEAHEVVSKTIGYEQTMSGQDWNGNLAFVADIQPDPKNAGNFHNLSDEVKADAVPGAYDVTDVYLGTVPGSTCSSGGLCNQQLIDTINDEGALFVNYIGHGSTQGWSSSILKVSSIGQMSNSDRFPIMLPMTCLEGYYISPNPAFPSLGESLVRAENKGAVASWSPTGLGVAHGHDILDKGLFEAVFEHDIRELGPATYLGKWRLLQAGISLEQIEEYTLFGDPALRINALDPDLHIEKTVEPEGQANPGDVLTYTLTFGNQADEATAHHVVISDILDSLLVSPTVLFTSANVISQRVGVTYAWEIADLAPGESGMIQFSAVVSPTTGPNVIVNEAQIYSPASSDVVSVTTGIQVPDLYVEKVGPAEASYFETVTYTISWGNIGASAAPGARLTDVMPPWLEYIEDDSGWLHNEPTPGVHIWEMQPAPLPTDTHGTFVMTAWIKMDAGMTSPLLNRVRVESQMPDGDPKNDKDAWETTLLLPDLSIDMSGALTVTPMSEIVYQVTYANLGDRAAENAVITDQLPAGVTYVSDNSGFVHTEPVPGTHVWLVQPEQIAPGQGGGFTIRALVGGYEWAGSVATNRVEIGSVTPDPVRGNNVATVESAVLRRYIYYLPNQYR